MPSDWWGSEGVVLFACDLVEECGLSCGGEKIDLYIGMGRI